MRIRSKLACLACSAFLIPIQAQAQWDAYTRAEAALFEDGDARAAIRYLTPLAESGELKAQTYVVAIYERGSCGFPVRAENCYALKKNLRPDPVQAAKWNRVLAAQGDQNAQLKLGAMYMSGRGGVPASYAEAVMWYRLAAEQGNLHAQAALGTIYMTGGDIPADYRESALWFRRAAEGGHPEAQKSLGFLYLTGQGVPMNVVYSLMWYRLVGQPDPRSREITRNLSAALSEEQISRVQQLAHDCWKANFKACATGYETELPARAPTAPEVVLYNVVTADDYPAISIRLQEQGTVGFKVRIGRTGAVADCEVTSSSGKPRLDDAACRTARKWLFLPALQDGAPIETEKTLNVVFQLM